MKTRIKQIVGWVCALAVVAGANSPFVRQIFAIPDQILISEGQAYTLEIPGLFTAQKNDTAVTKLMGTTLSDTGGNVDLLAQQPGEDKLTLQILGIPVKQVALEVTPEKNVMLGGQAIGVALYTKGALVVGTSDIMDSYGNLRNPANEAGLLAGDTILSVNGQEVQNAVHLSELINVGNSDPLQMHISRSGKEMDVSLTPILDPQDSVWRLGLWVRDSTAGVGTLTYLDPAQKWYGSLGHGIADSDTGNYLTVKNGEIYESHILGIQQGKVGEPGELQGDFFDQPLALGDIAQNNAFGLYGHSYAALDTLLKGRSIPIGLHSTVQPGEAQIVTTLDDSGPQRYTCQIERVTQQGTPTPKSMVLRVTDPELLSRTGGIVQGMSGSPIIQNGCLVGVVTHVFVNDPTRGYGMFIEWMLAQEP